MVVAFWMPRMSRVWAGKSHTLRSLSIPPCGQNRGARGACGATNTATRLSPHSSWTNEAGAPGFLAGGAREGDVLTHDHHFKLPFFYISPTFDYENMSDVQKVEQPYTHGLDSTMNISCTDGSQDLFLLLCHQSIKIYGISNFHYSVLKSTSVETWIWASPRPGLKIRI